MGLKDRRWSNDLNRDRVIDTIAVNLDIIERAITVAELARSNNERLRAVLAGQQPLTARTASSAPATNRDAA